MSTSDLGIEVRVELTIRGENLDPLRVSTDLRLAPCESWARGAVRRAGTPAPWGLWRFAVEPSGVGLKEQLAKLSEIVELRREVLLEYSKDPSYDVAVWIVMEFDSGRPTHFSLPSDAFMLLARSIPRIEFSIWQLEEEEE